MAKRKPRGGEFCQSSHPDLPEGEALTHEAAAKLHVMVEAMFAQAHRYGVRVRLVLRFPPEPDASPLMDAMDAAAEEYKP